MYITRGLPLITNWKFSKPLTCKINILYDAQSYFYYVDRVQKLAVRWKKVLWKPFKSVGKLFLAAMPEPTKTSTRSSSAPDQNSTFEPADSGPGGGEEDLLMMASLSQSLSLAF